MPLDGTVKDTRNFRLRKRGNYAILKVENNQQSFKNLYAKKKANNSTWPQAWLKQ